MYLVNLISPKKGSRSESSAALKECQYLWEEYKYRHDLIWQRIFRFTTAIVLISIIPYVQQDIVRLLDYWILIAPLLASILAAFVLLVMWNELKLFEKIKEAYRRQQNELLDDDLKHDLNEKSDFPLFVLTYLASLVLLSVINGFVENFEPLQWTEALRRQLPSCRQSVVIGDGAAYATLVPTPL